MRRPAANGAGRPFPFRALGDEETGVEASEDVRVTAIQRSMAGLLLRFGRFTATASQRWTKAVAEVGAKRCSQRTRIEYALLKRLTRVATVGRSVGK